MTFQAQILSTVPLIVLAIFTLCTSITSFIEGSTIYTFTVSIIYSFDNLYRFENGNQTI